MKRTMCNLFFLPNFPFLILLLIRKVSNVHFYLTIFRQPIDSNFRKNKNIHFFSSRRRKLRKNPIRKMTFYFRGPLQKEFYSLLKHVGLNIFKIESKLSNNL